jgi:hypothetical protein
MIRSMQAKLNQRTAQYAKQFNGEEPADPELRREVRGLSPRQLDIQRVTADLNGKKNE